MVTRVSVFSRYKSLVIKIGSAILIQDGALRVDWIEALCADIAELRRHGTDVLIVSSGAIALGCSVLGLERAKLTLPQKQACAAVGQSVLTRGYDDALQQHSLRGAQALLTLEDTENRRRYLNARATLQTLLSLGIVPIVNENDTVATAEIRYGDNDRLAARTAQMIGADALILLSDIDGLYTADPRINNDAAHVAVVETLTGDHIAMAGVANAARGIGSGGMATKLDAARIATEAGCDMFICDGRLAGVVGLLQTGEIKHTKFCRRSDPKAARAQWIAGSLAPGGSITIDTGAATALTQGRSLLAAGITRRDGTFGKGDAIEIKGLDGHVLAIGLSAYDAEDLDGVCGLRSEAIDHPTGPVVVHRDNLVMR
jgi:glutamate 5-kinase